MSNQAEKFQQGQIILIDKPYTWTSFDVVGKVRYLLKKELGLKKLKVGHAGTLDPLATGLLVICTGKFTKTIDEIQAQQKEYTGIITLGATTASYDLEKETDIDYPTEHISEEQIKTIAQSFIGEQLQEAPMHSAKKIDGKRAYEYARAGEEVVIKSNTINIYDFDVPAISQSLEEIKDKLTQIDIRLNPKINVAQPYENGLHVKFKIGCSKGTYIRAIARDFGTHLNSGGHLSELRRTKIGDFDVKNATLPTEGELIKLIHSI
ncbi:tRNA pseudouridine(55) synthase TruB [Vicingus serpentipes]|uniref:tRNA pseudouridine synthase B n=1 Tax=Vicingus serpentipes TaxID=1926625 RepID=A0A5C6RQV4_9FLAO|nr:tRNA pseudouridine(55) synthase TruB [Vicingus serpentipes]TXB64324.1 tRNA pseudouridine(55) synthase TruB [Vicingus serpentipes]